MVLYSLQRYSTAYEKKINQFFKSFRSYTIVKFLSKVINQAENNLLKNRTMQFEAINRYFQTK